MTIRDQVHNMRGQKMTYKAIARQLGCTVGRARSLSLPPVEKRKQTLFVQSIIAVGLPKPETEFVFHLTRLWRFDLAWETPFGIRGGPPLAMEIEGGTWGQKASRHSTGSGYEKDCEKYNEATLLGWRVLRVTTKMVNDGRALSLLLRAFGRE